MLGKNVREKTPFLVPSNVCLLPITCLEYHHVQIFMYLLEELAWPCHLKSHIIERAKCETLLLKIMNCQMNCQQGTNLKGGKHQQFVS